MFTLGIILRVFMILISQRKEMDTLEIFKNGTSVVPENATPTPSATDASANTVFDEYVVLGVIAFFVTTFFVIVICICVKKLRDAWCLDYNWRLLETYSSVTYDDDELLDSENESYTECRLYVDDQAIDTNRIVDEPEYDCRSTDGSMRGSIQESLPLQNTVNEKSRSLLALWKR